MHKLVSVLSDIVNSGIEVALVTSGAIGVGVGKLGLREKPADTPGRQAAATVGQCELMFMYDKLFSEYGHTVGQLLMTKSDVENTERRENLTNAFEKIFEFGAIPIVNENDSVAVEEIVYGDNDSLSAIVAKLIGADALIILTDIDGLYDTADSRSPRNHGGFGRGGRRTRFALRHGRHGYETACGADCNRRRRRHDCNERRGARGNLQSFGRQTGRHIFCR